jgi:hypothetical protein
MVSSCNLLQSARVGKQVCVCEGLLLPGEDWGLGPNKAWKLKERQGRCPMAQERRPSGVRWQGWWGPPFFHLPGLGLPGCTGHPAPGTWRALAEGLGSHPP